MTEKIDYKKTLKHLYQPSAKAPQIVAVPAMSFLMMDGEGNPNTSPAYQSAVEALFGVSYALKFMSKRAMGLDYVVMPLEGLWWGTPKGQHRFSEEEKANFLWTMMIMQPDHITAAMVAEAIGTVRRKKGLADLDSLRFTTFEEGIAVQILHIGSYDTEGPTVDRMHRFAYDRGYELRGKHHEIYLSDPRRTQPQKLKTILRHPLG